ncbi:hypothetical protein D3C84_200830 [compost metagenome]
MFAVVERERQVACQCLAEQHLCRLAEQFGGGRVDEAQLALAIHCKQALGDAVGDRRSELQLGFQAPFAGDHRLHQAVVLQYRDGHLGKLLGNRQVVRVEFTVVFVR